MRRGNGGKVQGRQTPNWRLPEKAAVQPARLLGWAGRVRFAVARLRGFPPSSLALVSVPARFATPEPRCVEPLGALASIHRPIPVARFRLGSCTRSFAS